jgi:hypothetical protein
LPKGFSTYIQGSITAFTLSNVKVTYNDAGNTLGRVAAALEVLGHDGEDAGRKRHVEETVGLRAALLEILKVLCKLVERLILVVLTGNVGAELAELVELLLNLLGGGLHVGANAAKILLVVHLRPGVADDSDIFGKELVSVL